jgi:ABC-type multidrug transport system ATPase subunit
MDAAVALEVRGLTRRFGARTAVSNLDLTVREGDVYGFLGPNGSGKTTAMRCVLGLLARHEGTVRIFGSDDLVGARRHVGAIIETPAFHTWLSGYENLKLSAAYAGLSGKAAETEVGRVLERVGLTERAKDRAGTYSLGMKQRLGIARSLLGQPKLLLLDEPTNGLDPRGMSELREFVRSLALHDGITVFVSSHLLAEVQAICNRVGILQDGRLRAEGAVAELLSGSVENVVEIDADAAAVASWAESAGAKVLGPGVAGRTRVHLGSMHPADANASLVGAGVRVAALVPTTRSLEDVFLEVTS